MQRLQELSFVAEIYAELMDSDSFEGAMRMKSDESTLSEQILTNNITGLIIILFFIFFFLYI